MRIERGNVLKADLGRHVSDNVQGGIRPVVVVSNNKCNKHSNVISVVPLTSRIFEKKNLPTHVFINASENEGLDRNSLALCEQVTILPHGKIIDFKYGKLNDCVMDEITKAIQIQLGVYPQFN